MWFLFPSIDCFIFFFFFLWNGYFCKINHMKFTLAHLRRKLIWHAETIKFICLLSKTSMSFDQDYYCLLCLRDYQVCWVAETIMVIRLYFSKTIIVFLLMETIRVIRLYFSKTIIVFCLAKTIRGIRLYFSRLSKSVVMRRQSWSSSFFTFPRLS